MPRLIPDSLTGSISSLSIPDFTLYVPASTPTPELRVVEIKTCQDLDPSPQLLKAKRQHLHLVRLLQQRNPHVQVYLHIILVGQMGSIYREYTTTPLEQLGLTANPLHKLTKQLHLTAIHSLTSIVRSRRRLEPVLSSLKRYLANRKFSSRALPRKRISPVDFSPGPSLRDSRQARRFTVDSTPRRCRHSSGVT